MALVVKPVEFVPYRSDPPKKINLAIDGVDKSGKTHLALTAPGPIVFHDWDFGLHGVADKFPDKEIYHFEYELTETLALPGTEEQGLSGPAAKVWERYVYNMRASIEKCLPTADRPVPGTIITDSASTAWPCLRLARLGKLTEVMPTQYMKVNSEFQTLIQLVHRSPVNVIWLSRLKNVYQGNVKTDQLERDGYNQLGFEVDAVVRLLEDTTKVGESAFTARFGNCRTNRSLQRTELPSDLTFAKIATTMYPATTEEMWK
jgi:hypothetical protein